MKLTIPASIIVAALLIALSISIINFSQRKSDYITVGGQAEAVVQPDSAVVYATVRTLADTAEQAQQEGAATAAKVQGALTNVRVETSSYNLNRNTEWTAEGPVDKGY